MSQRGEILVAIVNNMRDFAIINEQHWYRIPESSVKKWLKDRWPPQWIAFYQTKAFGSEAHAVNYYAQVIEIKRVLRTDLFPNEIPGKNSSKRYFQLILGPLQKLPKPIPSRRWRRIVFIPTTWQKFVNAVEINDLSDESPLEDRLWAEFKRHNIPAERQEFIAIMEQNYSLDFAIYCSSGSIDVETDGDSWHANPKKAAEDNLRDNALESRGWNVLRFSTTQIVDQVADYCMPRIADTINALGGVDEGKYIPRKIDLGADGFYQLGLFDDINAE